MIDKETILRIARESGIKTRPYVIGSPESEWFGKLEVLEAFANSVATATVSRLAAGVSVEPVASFWRERNQSLYPGISIGLTTAGDALPLGERHKLYDATAIAAARVRALEDALSVCDDDRHVNAIRELIGDKNARN